MISFIVVNFRTDDLLPDCIKAIRTSMNFASSPEFEIILVNNDPRQNLSAWENEASVFLIQNHSNFGFARAVNQGIRRSKGSLIWLVNPDARLCDGCAQVLLEFMKSHPEAGIAAPMLINAQGHLHIQISATGVFPSPFQCLLEHSTLRFLPFKKPHLETYFISNWDRKSTRPVAMVQGACFLIKRNLIDQIGPFDERFFLYFEETDFCLRACRAGTHVYYVAEAQCTHLGGQSISRTADAYPQNTYHFFRSLILYHKKHSGLFKAGLIQVLLLLDIPLEWMAQILTPLIKNRREQIKNYFTYFRRISQKAADKTRALIGL